MRCWFCTDIDYDGGFYIVAETIGKAKKLFSQETNLEFTRVRARLVKRASAIQTAKLPEMIVHVEDIKVLKKLGLHYYDDGGKPIPYTLYK